MGSKKRNYRDLRLYLTKELGNKLEILCRNNDLDPAELISGSIEHLWRMAEREVEGNEEISETKGD